MNATWSLSSPRFSRGARARLIGLSALLLSACAGELDEPLEADETPAAEAEDAELAGNLGDGVPYAAPGALGAACKTGGACNGKLVCGKSFTCVDPIAASSRWFGAFQGCDSNDADCNVCATNVKQQFDDAFDSGTMRWDNASWGFNWETNYPPSDREPDNVFEEHVQGFARTNRDPYRFVGSYSDEDGGNGGIFFVHRADGGQKKLSKIHTTRHAHPSGLSVLGRFVAFSDQASTVRLIDMNKIDEAHLIEFHASGMSRAGGGIGLTKLAGDGYLLVVSPKGSHDDHHREVRFYHLHGSITSPEVTPVGTWTYVQPASWSGDYRYTENLTVIPECGTGDVYVVNTSGDDRLLGRGWWLLSKVVQKKDEGLTLKPLRAYHMDQEQARCHLRSSATVFVGSDHNLQLICHERAAVNGWLDGNADDMRFKHGYNYAD